MDFDEVLKFYSNPLVQKEIVDYSNKRWVAVECEPKEGRRIFLRYWGRQGPPLHISKTEDLTSLINRFKGLRPRTFYASVNLYSRLKSVEDTENLDNILYSSPIWDIDGSPDYYKETLEIAELITNFLKEEGVHKSVFLKWSGRGVHVHIHEKAFSKETISSHNPLDIAYSVVEYVNRVLYDELKEKITKFEAENHPINVENKIDLKRVFTSPLSLHREVGFCCVCFKPEKIHKFKIDWAKPQTFKHDQNWRTYEEGEADELAVKALKEIGGYNWPGSKRKTGLTATVFPTRKKTETVKTHKLGRFQVMALLQAARYYLLTKDLEKAKSFGLNRAIFYAWAKRKGIGRVPSRKKKEIVEKGEVTKEVREGKTLVYLGNEGAFVSKEGWFTIGNTLQTPNDYSREIEHKISLVIPYSTAWEAAINYLKKFPKEVLLSQSKFFSKAYKPIRDSFLELVQTS